MCVWWAMRVGFGSCARRKAATANDDAHLGNASIKV